MRQSELFDHLCECGCSQTESQAACLWQSRSGDATVSISADSFISSQVATEICRTLGVPPPPVCAPIRARLYQWPEAVRPCRFCLSLQGDSVFADFDVDGQGQLSIVRISFDGYGCCRLSEHRPLGPVASQSLLTMVDNDELEEVTVDRILRDYLQVNSDVIWKDALEDHALIDRMED